MGHRIIARDYRWCTILACDYRQCRNLGSTESLPVTINSTESLLVTTNSAESFVTTDSAGSLLATTDSTKSVLVTTLYLVSLVLALCPTFPRSTFERTTGGKFLDANKEDRHTLILATSICAKGFYGSQWRLRIRLILCSSVSHNFNRILGSHKIPCILDKGNLSGCGLQWHCKSQRRKKTTK